MSLETAVYGTRTHADDFWVQAGNDIVLFDLLQRQESIEARLLRLPYDHLDRDVLERMSVALKLGIAGHEIQSSISQYPIRSERGRDLDLSTRFILGHA